MAEPLLDAARRGFRRRHAGRRRCRSPQQQLVEIAKALSLNARLVIMDEPTSSLTRHGDRAAARDDRAAEAPRASASSSSRIA